MAGIEVATGELLREHHNSLVIELHSLDKRPNCEAKRQNIYWNDEPNKTYYCQFKAKYIVAGKTVCARHAGGEALKILKGLML
jgi:hypothetical protein